MSTRSSQPEAWFEKAEHDRAAIRAVVATDPPIWDIATFHAQQAAEKYLKGFIVARGGVPPKIHDLTTLLALCHEFDSTLSGLEESCGVLTGLGWVARYPDSPEDPSEVEGKRAVELADQICTAIRERVPKSEPR